MTLGMTANAALLTVNCSGSGINSAGTITLTCGSFSAAAGNDGVNNISSFTANLIGNWSDGLGGTNHAFSYSFTLAAPLTLATTLNSAVSNAGTGSTGASGQLAVGGGPQLFSFTPGNITVNVAAISGTAFPSASVTAAAQISGTQTASTPEPTTFALLGPALIALGAFARRRRQ